MVNALEGVKVIEVGGAASMPLAGMLMASWGAEVIHVEPPGKGDLARMMSHRLSAWTQYSEKLKFSTIRLNCQKHRRKLNRRHRNLVSTRKIFSSNWVMRIRQFLK